MFPTSRTKQVFWLFVLANIILLAAFVGLYYLLNNQAVAANRLSQEIERIRSEQQQEQALDQLVASTAEPRDVLNSFFVQPNESAEFITTIESLADETNVSLQIGNVSVAPIGAGASDQSTAEGGNQESDSQSDYFESLRLEMQATGEWQRVIHFVRTLELLPKETEVTNVSFGQSGDPGPNDSTPSWRVNLTVVAHKITAQ